jgi:nucleoside-diphosphate-sugar epimerase
VDAVVYLAARVHRIGEHGADAAYDGVNRSAPVRLAAEAAQSGVHRFLYLSSIKVNGEHTRGQPFGDCRAAPADAYARSKHRAERELLGVAEATGMSLVILRPPLIYGPGVRANFLRLMRLVERAGKVPLPLASVQNARSLMFVENLADAIVTAAVGGPSGCYTVADPDSMSVPELMTRLGDALGARPKLIPFPVSLLRFVGRLTGRAEAMGRLTDSLVVDPSAFMRDFGWQPPFTTRQGLDATAVWFRGSSGGHKDAE